MVQGPTRELLDRMATDDLWPKTIIWDGRRHRFPGARKKRGTDAWYIAYPDRRGAHFGDWSTGVKQHWMLRRTKPVSAEEKLNWDAERERQAKEREKKHQEALKQVLKLWNAARTPEPKKEPHPYLLNKEIDEYPNLRISTLTEVAKNWKVPAGLLLVPMYRAGQLVNIQRIWPNGDKRYWPGAEAIGACYEFGIKAGEPEAGPDAPYYITEGWVTGYTIYRATGCPVIVAFSAGGLLPVAQELRDKRNPKRIIIAADNDRWSKIAGQDGDVPNPGVHYAREAAKAVDGEVAIPDFEDLEGKPTDFDDLRLREGENAVRKWLDPAMASTAVTIAEPEPDEDEDMSKTGNQDEEHEEWKKTAPFRALGHNEGTYTLLSEWSGQARTFTESDLAKSRPYYSLAPRPWWCHHFEHKGSAPGFHLEDASWAVISACLEAGVFDSAQCRGRGAWVTEDGEIVLHLGDRLLVSGTEEFTYPERFEDGDRIYPRLRRLSGPAMKKPMPLEEARQTLALFDDLPWQNDASGTLAAGALVLAPFSGALPCRPLLWITGPTESGKSTIINRIIAPMLDGIGVICREAYGTSDVALRQLLGSDALPVILDHADMVGRGARRKLGCLFDLARLSSTGGTVSTETASGRAHNLSVRSMFLFASVEVGLKLGQDENRVAILSLRNPKTEDLEDRQKRWVATQRQIIDLISPMNGRRLMARTAQWFRDGRFDELLKVTSQAALPVQASRAGELYGTLLAGAWTLRSDTVPDVEEVIAWIVDSGLRATGAENRADGRDVLGSLLGASVPLVIRDHEIEVTIGRLIRIASGQPQSDPVVSRSAADRRLRECGMRWHGGDLHLANRSPFIIARMRGTPFEGRWIAALRTLPGVRPAGIPMRFTTDLVSRTTAVPLDVLPLPPSFGSHHQRAESGP